MLTIVAMAAVATVVYATVATVVRSIDNPDRTRAQRAAGWAVLVLVLTGIAAVMIGADKNVIVGFCIGALIAPVSNELLTRRTDRTDDRF